MSLTLEKPPLCMGRGERKVTQSIFCGSDGSFEPRGRLGRIGGRSGFLGCLDQLVSFGRNHLTWLRCFLLVSLKKKQNKKEHANGGPQTRTNNKNTNSGGPPNHAHPTRCLISRLGSLEFAGVSLKRGGPLSGFRDSGGKGTFVPSVFALAKASSQGLEVQTKEQVRFVRAP